jgi:hypothetical protein
MIKRILPILLIAALLLSGCGFYEILLEDDSSEPEETGATTADVDYEDLSEEFPTIAGSQRDYRTQIMGGGEDTVTVMIYLCGSDLETYGGAASADLGEMMLAESQNENLNILVETGGSTSWTNYMVDADTNQRYKITDGEMELIEDVGSRNMSEGETLTDFITWSAENYPANRYMLIMWDHGGGTVGGLIIDERYDTYESMPITELGDALDNSGVTFDMIGFDCCLMSTVETAFMVENYADYMIASQLVEPSSGWHYTEFLQALDENTSIPTEDLGVIIADEYFDNSDNILLIFENDLTMSVLDLTYVPAMFEAMDKFFASAQEVLVSDEGFIQVSQTAAETRAISENDDLADLLTLVNSMGGSEELQARISDVVVYNKSNVDGHNGMCLYFPYRDLSKVSDALYIYDEIGITGSYKEFITTFASIVAGGQIYQGGGSDSPYGNDDWSEDTYDDYDWMDSDVAEEYSYLYEDTAFDSDELYLEAVDDYFVLNLSYEQQGLITDFLLRAFVDDGEGWIDLGADAYYEFDEYGNLIIDFDNTWVSLNGQTVCFYSIEDVSFGNGSWYNYGYVPCEINDRAAELIVMWDAQNPGGFVAGWRYDTEGSASMKGLFELTDGMEIYFVCDYYTYDNEFDASYYFGEPLIVSGEVEVSYEDVGENDVEVYYELYDIYQNTYWTESLIYSYE